jgi:hypothetical protein
MTMLVINVSSSVAVTLPGILMLVLSSRSIAAGR